MTILIVIIAILAVLVLLLLYMLGSTINPDNNGVNIKFMITIPDNQPDGTINVALGGEYLDAEGVAVPVSFVDPTTDNPEAFGFENFTNDGNALSIDYHVGSPGLATVVFAVKRDDTGAVIQNAAFVINVTAGEIVNFPPLSIDLGGLPADA